MRRHGGGWVELGPGGGGEGGRGEWEGVCTGLPKRHGGGWGGLRGLVG
jgi:hypothetical protein